LLSTGPARRRPFRRSPMLALATVMLSVLVLPAPRAVADTGASAFGISTGGAIQNEEPATLARDLDVIGNVGSNWIRIDINWAQIQSKGPSSYDWASIDRVVEAAAGRGIDVLGVIMYTPDWARPSGTPSTYRPDPEQYAAFAERAASHYAALGVHAYEIWNEPNMKAFWSPRPDAGDYAHLLQAAYPAIKSADPDATVVTGGTAPSPSDGTDYSPVDFLKGIYASGGAGSFDAVGHHPYCWPAYPGDAESWSAWYQMYGTHPSLRSVMVANGDGDKKIWATEFGAPTGGPSHSSFVSERAQAKMLTRAYGLWRGYDWSGPLFAFQGRDQGANSHSMENSFGMVRHDWTRKPAYRAYRAAADAARGGIPAPAPTTTKVAVERRRGTSINAARRSRVRGRVRPDGSSGTQLGGRVSLRVYRRAHHDWRAASHRRLAKVGQSGKFHTHLGRFGRRILRPGTYRIRARFLGSHLVRPSASRYRKFKVRR
jgi:polysaccharide biosynthesis protein PslG